MLAGRVIKINPTLITLTDGLIDQVDPQTPQQQVWERVVALLAHKICTFHVDLNLDDYTSFGQTRPQSNLAVFTPTFLERLSLLIASSGGFLNLHLLTDFPQRHLAEWASLPPGGDQLSVGGGQGPQTARTARQPDRGAGILRQPGD